MRFAANHVDQTWHTLPGNINLGTVRQTQMQLALGNLEDTYIIRLFSEFEAVLQDHLNNAQPQRVAPWRAEHLINRVASLHRIAPGVRDGAHRVRTYRNSLVHRQTTPGVVMPFANATASLNRFLAWLP